MHRETRAVETETLAEIDDGTTVTEVGLVTTPKGKRLQILVPATGEEIWLDALGLESVSWQDDDVVAQLVGAWLGPDSGSPPPSTGDDAHRDHLTEIRNEYAIVNLYRVGGTALEIESRRLGYTRRLSATELGALAARDASLLTEFLATPFGPE